MKCYEVSCDCRNEREEEAFIHASWSARVFQSKSHFAVFTSESVTCPVGARLPFWNLEFLLLRQQRSAFTPSRILIISSLAFIHVQQGHRRYGTRDTGDRVMCKAMRKVSKTVTTCALFLFVRSFRNVAQGFLLRNAQLERSSRASLSHLCCSSRLCRTG